jgi:hypothetical protein
MTKRLKNLWFSNRIILIPITVVLVFTSVFFLYGKSILLPGPVSAVAPRGEMIDGYSSHADFEQECSHCHAPVHCITDTRCQDCHIDVAKQRLDGEGLHSRLPGTARCQTCHVEHRGREMLITDFAYSNVDHDRLTNFSLDNHLENFDGSQLVCDSCHQYDRFNTETLECVNCHVEADHDGMAVHLERFGSDCTSCHDGRDRYSDFDHDNYYLKEYAHAEAECEACHIERVFVGTTRECSGCHEDSTLHFDLFGFDCQRCHTAAGWAPALLTSHTFDLEHGGEGQIECQVCHSSNYLEISCYGCHDHQEDDIRESHLVEDIIELDECAACHPTGISGEARTIMDGAEQIDENDGDSTGR